MINLPVIDDSIKNKRVLVRGDIDVPLQTSKTSQTSQTIADDTRLKDIKPTIDFLLKNNNQVVLCGHIGRPNGKVVAGLSTKIISNWFKKEDSGVAQNDRLIVLENLRFDPREEANDPEFARGLADLADIYVNESFANCERTHASMVGVPKLLPHFSGFRLAKEVEVLSKVLENPTRPLLVIIGGAKIETKQPLIDKMKTFADTVIVSEKIASPARGRGRNDINTDFFDKFSEIFINAKTIIWNGPFGQIEDEKYQAGTKRLVELILENNEAYKIVGGGDTIGFINKLGLTDKFNWVCTGGGSMLKFLSGTKLPGIQALI